MQKINRTFKTLRSRFIHTYGYDNSRVSVVDVTNIFHFQGQGWRATFFFTTSDMMFSFRGVLNTKNQPCSRSNRVELACFLCWYYNEKYKYRHRRTLLQIFHWIVHLKTFQKTISRLACAGKRKRLWPCASYESAL